MHDPVDPADGELMSPAAEQLRVLATMVSAVCGRPGFVPDAYLDELVGDELGHLGAGPAVLAAELCRAGIWERAGAATAYSTRKRSRCAPTGSASCGSKTPSWRTGRTGCAACPRQAPRARPGSGTWRPGVADLGAGKLGVDVLAKPVEEHGLLDSHGDRRQVVKQPTRRTPQLQ